MVRNMAVGSASRVALAGGLIALVAAFYLHERTERERHAALMHEIHELRTMVSAPAPARGVGRCTFDSREVEAVAAQRGCVYSGSLPRRRRTTYRGIDTPYGLRVASRARSAASENLRSAEEEVSLSVVW